MDREQKFRPEQDIVQPQNSAAESHLRRARSIKRISFAVRTVAAVSVVTAGYLMVGRAGVNAEGGDEECNPSCLATIPATPERKTTAAPKTTKTPHQESPTSVPTSTNTPEASATPTPGDMTPISETPVRTTTSRPKVTPTFHAEDTETPEATKTREKRERRKTPTVTEEATQTNTPAIVESSTPTNTPVVTAPGQPGLPEAGTGGRKDVGAFGTLAAAVLAGGAVVTMSGKSIRERIGQYKRKA